MDDHAHIPGNELLAEIRATRNELRAERERARELERRHAALCQIVASLAGQARGVVAVVEDPDESGPNLLAVLKRIGEAGDTALSRHGCQPDRIQRGQQLTIGSTAPGERDGGH